MSKSRALPFAGIPHSEKVKRSPKSEGEIVVLKISFFLGMKLVVSKQTKTANRVRVTLVLIFDDS